MAITAGGEVLGQGKFLRLVRRDGWEFVERIGPIGSAFIAALTDNGCLLLTKEYRVPVGKTVVGFPAGLIGDVAGLQAESVEEAVKRELLEETGFEAERISFLTEGPTSPGMTEEVIAIVLAEGLRKIGPGGGVQGENILIHEVPLAEVDDWLQERARRLPDRPQGVYRPLLHPQAARAKWSQFQMSGIWRKRRLKRTFLRDDLSRLGGGVFEQTVRLEPDIRQERLSRFVKRHGLSRCPARR